MHRTDWQLLASFLRYLPHLEDQRSELPEQYRIIGFADGQLTTFILQKISRQDWIKMVCAEKIREIQASRISKAV